MFMGQEMESLTGSDLSMKPLRVVVAEDEPLLAMLLEDVLKEMGHEVCAIESTEAGTVAAGLRFRPDILIVDPGLLRGSGISAVTEILRTVFIAHVFVSGDKLWDRQLHPRAITLQKPFRESDLASAIQRAMGAPSST
jgi:DNA-binding response OmpR family regulator